jgi:peptidoglycan/xylan/chitin deacetylase (PgdA/CDA1 family)
MTPRAWSARLLVGLALATSLLAIPLLATAEAAPAQQDTGPTTVSFTFTGGYRGQEAAARILARHDVAGTFYVSSRFVGLPDYLDAADLRAISASGSEIGGGTTRHQDLATMPAERVLQEVCADRSNLSSRGFPMTSFAYPHGSWTYTAQTAVQRCGYNSARGLAQLRVSDSHCSACPPSESLPPLNVYDLRTTSPDADVTALEQTIARAQSAGGGWVVVALDHVCGCPDLGRDALSPREFERLVRWVTHRPGLHVRTVDDVVGGSVRPVPPVLTVETTRAAALQQDKAIPLSRRPAWTVFGVGIGQVQILFSGLLLAAAVVATYRVSTRGSRYGR